MNTDKGAITVHYRHIGSEDRTRVIKYSKSEKCEKINLENNVCVRMEDWKKHDFSDVINDTDSHLLFFKDNDGNPEVCTNERYYGTLTLKITKPAQFDKVYTNLDTKSEFGICQRTDSVETWHKDVGKYCIDIFRKRICLDRFVQDHNKDLCTLDAIQTTIRHEVLKLWWTGNDAVLYKSVYALETKDGNDALYVSGEVDNPEAVSGYHY